MENAWDINRKVEENVYFNFDEPLITDRKNKDNPLVHVENLCHLSMLSCSKWNKKNKWHIHLRRPYHSCHSLAHIVTARHLSSFF